MNNTTSRRALIAGTAAAIVTGGMAIATNAKGDTLSVASAPTPFRIAEARYRAAAQRFNNLPEHLETTDPARFEREEEVLSEGSDVFEEAVPHVVDWSEFADAIDIASDGGRTTIETKNAASLLTAARRLAGRA